jgi:hypothetical protein
MSKKDTASTVLGMLSTAGSQTRPLAEVLDPASVTRERVVPNLPRAGRPVTPAVSRQVRALDPAPADGGVVDDYDGAAGVPAPKPACDDAPRTMRMRPATALALRNAWLEAKRDDVLLTAQDFASDLVDEALMRRLRRPAVSSQ